MLPDYASRFGMQVAAVILSSYFYGFYGSSWEPFTFWEYRRDCVRLLCRWMPLGYTSSPATRQGWSITWIGIVCSALDCRLSRVLPFPQKLIGTHWNMLATAFSFGASTFSWCSRWKKHRLVHWQDGTISRVQLRKAHVDHRDCLLWSEFSRAAFCRGGLIGYVCIVYCGKNLKLKVVSSTAAKQKLSWSSSWSSRCFNFVALI